MAPEFKLGSFCGSGLVSVSVSYLKGLWEGMNAWSVHRVIKQETR